MNINKIQVSDQGIGEKELNTKIFGTSTASERSEKGGEKSVSDENSELVINKNVMEIFKGKYCLQRGSND